MRLVVVVVGRGSAALPFVVSDNSGGETAQNAELVLRALAARVKLPESAAEDELEMLEQEVERQVLEQVVERQWHDLGHYWCRMCIAVTSSHI